MVRDEWARLFSSSRTRREGFTKRVAPSCFVLVQKSTLTSIRVQNRCSRESPSVKRACAFWEIGESKKRRSGAIAFLFCSGVPFATYRTLGETAAADAVRRAERRNVGAAAATFMVAPIACGYDEMRGRTKLDTINDHALPD